jgi:type II secretory pathway component HofQ
MGPRDGGGSSELGHEVDHRRMRLRLLLLILLAACASSPKPAADPGISMEVTAVRQGADEVLVTAQFTDESGAILAAPRVLAKVGEDATVAIAGGDPAIDVVVKSREQGRLLVVDVSASVRYADGRTASPVASLSTSWGLPSRSGR